MELCQIKSLPKPNLSRVNTRNGIVRSLINSQWGANPNVLRSSALALCYAPAEYACPVWGRSAHVHRLDSVLNDTCRLITGCLKPTNVNQLHMLAGIAPPHIRRETLSMAERSRQSLDTRHPLHGHEPPATRLKSRKNFIKSTNPLTDSRSTTKETKWELLLSENNTPNWNAKESLPAGSDLDWRAWKSLNRLRCCVGSFLKCPQRLVRWLNAIPRKNWTPSKSSVVCAKHFKYDLHRLETDLSRKEKEHDKNSNANIVAVYDLQAVLPCPSGDANSFYYVSKLNVLNLTVCNIKTKDVQCYVWHEGEAQRGVNEIGTCILRYLESLQEDVYKKHVIFYSDNCGGQQKNRFMIAAYMYAVQHFDWLESITHKYLIKGHSQNEGDSAHSLIERQIKRSAKKSGQPYKVDELCHKDIFDLKQLASDIGFTSYPKKNTDGDPLKISEIKVLKIMKDSPETILYKTSLPARRISNHKLNTQKEKQKSRNKISKPQIISPKESVTEISSRHIVTELLNKIIEDAIKISEKGHLAKFTKKGKKQKRKIHVNSLVERKKQKREEKIAKHGVAINTNRQNAINKEFWEVTYEQQRQFIFSSVKKIDKKRKTKDGDSRRSSTIVYYLKSDSGTDVNVCKNFFLAILGYQVHNDRIVRDVLNKSDAKNLLIKPLKRGHPSEKQIDRKPIIDHINSLNPRISHYRREHAPNRKYLPSDSNIKLMHSDFLKKYPKLSVSYELYRQQAMRNVGNESHSIYTQKSPNIRKQIFILIAIIAKNGNFIMNRQSKQEKNIKLTPLQPPSGGKVIETNRKGTRF
nr:unnamed protein product [Callosobruchus chinensis]